MDKKVYALDGATGAKQWESLTGSYVYSGVFSSPAIGEDGTIYIGSLDRKVYALNGATGAKQWEFVTGGLVRSSPAIGIDGTIYVGSNDGKIYALDGKTGVKKWEFKTKAEVWSSPAIGIDGSVYIGSSDGKVYAIKTDSKSLANSPWPMHGQNPQHTRRVPVPELEKTDVKVWPGKKVVWTINGGNPIRRIDQIYLNKPEATLQKVFGPPDAKVGDYLIYKGMTVRDIGVGGTRTTILFGIRNGKIVDIQAKP